MGEKPVKKLTVAEWAETYRVRVPCTIFVYPTKEAADQAVRDRCSPMEIGHWSRGGKRRDNHYLDATVCALYSVNFQLELERKVLASRRRKIFFICLLVAIAVMGVVYGQR